MSEFWRLPQVPTRTANGTGLCVSLPADTNARACNCIGPQNGQPRCPCMMVGIVERDGRWVQLERDLGPVRPRWPTPNTSSRSE